MNFQSFELRELTFIMMSICCRSYYMHMFFITTFVETRFVAHCQIKIYTSMSIITFAHYCKYCTKRSAKLGVSHPTHTCSLCTIYCASNVTNLKEMYKNCTVRVCSVRHLPFSMASINASVSLLLIQSINCPCDLFADESSLLKPGIVPGLLPLVGLYDLQNFK